MIRLTLIALAAWVITTAVRAEEGSTLFLRACANGQCKTIRIAVEACTAGGQAALAQWLAEHPNGKVVTFKCFDGEPA